MRHSALALLTFAMGTLTQPANATPAPAESLRPPIIDMHLHAFGLDEGEMPPPNPVTRKPSSATSTSAIREQSLAALKRFNIVKAVTSGSPENVAAWRKPAPDVIVPGLSEEQKRDIFYNIAARFLGIEEFR